MSIPAKIRWAPPLRTELLKRLYDSDATRLEDLELCDEVGITLYLRCQTFVHTNRSEVKCPACGAVFRVGCEGQSVCPRNNCGWHTTWAVYLQSIRNHGAYTGRAVEAYLTFYRTYPEARTYKQKMLLIDQLIHSFHIDLKTGREVKSIASKLLEGNKKTVVRFLNELSAINPEAKETWRRKMTMTIDGRIVRNDAAGKNP